MNVRRYRRTRAWTDVLAMYSRGGQLATSWPRWVIIFRRRARIVGASIYRPGLVLLTLVAVGCSCVMSLAGSGLLGQRRTVLDVLPSSQDAVHVEYPAVVTGPDGLLLYYSAFGVDRRWRIKLATSSNGAEWHRQGQVFSESVDFPIMGNYAFPTVAQIPAGNFVMVFSGETNPGTGYDGLFLTTSDDGWHWQVPHVVLSGVRALDPLLIIDNSGLLKLYYVVADNTSGSVYRTVSYDGKEWSTPETVWSRNPAEGSIYTIGSFIYGDVRLFLIEGTLHGNHLWSALCQNHENQLVNLPRNDVQTDEAGRGGPMLYGMAFVNNTFPEITYFNEIADQGIEFGGRIRSAETNNRLLNDLNLAHCARSTSTKKR